MPNQATPNYLVVGHVTKDITSVGPLLGGPAGYSGMTAHKLGMAAAIVTSAGPDIPSLSILDGIELKTLPAPESTTFENIYAKGTRRQKWSATARPIAVEDIPPQWRQAPVVHLAPVSQEISPSLCAEFPGSLICVTIQGWLRGQDAETNVIYKKHPELESYLSAIDVLVLSRHDMHNDDETRLRLLTSVNVGLETLGPGGCCLYHNGETIHIPVPPANEIDSTGAGDIFATAFFVKYRQTYNPIISAQFANACASLSVTRPGIDSVPTLAQVTAYMKRLYTEY